MFALFIVCENGLFEVFVRKKFQGKLNLQLSWFLFEVTCSVFSFSGNLKKFIIYIYINAKI